MKWSKLEPYAISEGIDDVFTRVGRPINIREVKTYKGDKAIQIFYEGDDGKYHYHRIYEKDDKTLYKAIKATMKKAEKGG